MITYVALTALESHWGEPGCTRFLDDWCKVDARKHIWSNYPQGVLSSRWGAHEKSLEAIDYVTKLGKRLALEMGHRLDTHYALGRDQRFSQKMLSPWAINFASILDDRYFAVTDATSYAQNPVFLTAGTWKHPQPACDLTEPTARFAVHTSR